MRKLTMEELNRLSKDQYEEVEKLPVIMVLDNIRSFALRIVKSIRRRWAQTRLCVGAIFRLQRMHVVN